MGTDHAATPSEDATCARCGESIAPAIAAVLGPRPVSRWPAPLRGVRTSRARHRHPGHGAPGRSHHAAEHELPQLALIVRLARLPAGGRWRRGDGEHGRLLHRRVLELEGRSHPIARHVLEPGRQVFPPRVADQHARATRRRGPEPFDHPGAHRLLVADIARQDHVAVGRWRAERVDACEPDMDAC